MKIMAIADEEKRAFWDYFDKSRFADVDLIISCGDLKASYLDFLVSMTNKPLLYVHGNHDQDYRRKSPQGCTCIEDRVYDFHGLRILGLGGSVRYNQGIFQYTEEEMSRRIRRVNNAIALRGGIDMLVTHAPAKGYGDMEDLPHWGFACFNDLIRRWKPKYMLHGHVHLSYGGDRFHVHEVGTRIINAYECYELEVGDEDHPLEGKTGSALYDLYVSMSRKRNK